MHKPVIMTVDDDLVVLNAVGRDLHARYQRDYQIVEVGSGSQALETILKLKQRSTPLALLLVDQRMPGMSGTELLARAIKFYPDAKRVLLTAYSDTEAAIQSINEIDLDFYLLKPWQPPQEKLYPLLDELLSEWTAMHIEPYEGLRVVGARWSTNSQDVKDLLNDHQIPYQWLDLEADRAAKNLLESVKNYDDRLPVLFFTDGSLMIEPEIQQLAEKLELQTKKPVPFYDLIIVGGGAAGLSASLSGASLGLRTLMIESGNLGGRAAAAKHIDTFQGFPAGISGADLVTKAAAISKMSSVEITNGKSANEVRIDDLYRFVILDDGTELSCHALLVATGMDRTLLEIPGVENLQEAGVYYDAAPAEIPKTEAQDVFIIGWDDDAGRAALAISRVASEVTILSTEKSLSDRMSSYLVKEISRIANIRMQEFIELGGLEGSDRLESINFTNRETGETVSESADAVFIFSANRPRSELVANFLDLDKDGFILTGPDLLENGRPPLSWTLNRDPFFLETSVSGIFAAGDVRHGSVKRVAAAFAEGAAAVQLIQQHLNSV